MNQPHSLNTVVDFDTFRANSKLKQMEISNGEDDISEEQMNIMAVQITQDIVDELVEYGYDPTNNPDSIKEIYGMVENLRAYMYRCTNQKHILHGINNTLFDLKDTKETLNDFLNIE